MRCAACILVRVRARVVRGAALLQTHTRIVVVLFPAHHQLIALTQQSGGSPRNLGVLVATSAQQVRGLPDRGNHFLRALDRVVRTVVLHRHLEVRVVLQVLA